MSYGRLIGQREALCGEREVMKRWAESLQAQWQAALYGVLKAAYCARIVLKLGQKTFPPHNYLCLHPSNIALTSPSSDPLLPPNADCFHLLFY